MYPRTITLEIAATESVENLKNLINEMECIPPHYQILIFDKNILNDGKILSEYNIKQESTLHIVLRVPENEKTTKYLQGIVDLQTKFARAERNLENKS